MSNLNEGFKVPNFSQMDSRQGSEIGILNKMNALHESKEVPTPAEDGAMNESAGQTATCTKCGATWTPEVTTEDGAGQICPVCGSALTDPSQAGTQDSVVEDEQTTDEIAQAKLESTLQEYIDLVDAGSIDEAKQLVESEEAAVICESCEDGSTDIMLEKFVIKVGADGKKVKKKVRTKKMKRTAAQKAALKKARRTANNGAAKKKRKKAMKARARMGLNESIRKTQISNAVVQMLESQGMTIEYKLVEKAINEAYHMNEAEVQLPADKALSALETILNNYGLAVTESSTEVIDGVLVAHVSVQDVDAEVYLGDIADEVEESVEGYSVDYDEPEDPDEDGIVDIDFYFVPAITVNENADPQPESEPEVGALGECDDPDKSKKLDEGIQTNDYSALFESFAGGTDNVRCKMNPAFIKPNQLIFDADEQTVFKALTESVATEDGFKLAIEVCNSKNAQLADLAPGAEVTLGATGDYFLLRNNPLA